MSQLWVKISADGTDGGFWAECSRVGVVTSGETITETLRSLADAIDETDAALAARTISDDYSTWQMCERPRCGLEVVRIGKVQCWCDDPSAVEPEEGDL